MERSMQAKNTITPLPLWKFGLAMASMMFASTIYAQDLRLFEDIDAANVENRRTNSPRLNAGPNTNGPILALIGISRIGNMYSIILRDENDKSVLLRANPESINVMIPDYPGYSISQISSEGVDLTYPENSVCVELPSNGITCVDDNVARLSLAKMEPLQVAEVNEIGSAQINEEEAESPVNPFEAIARRARTSDSDVSENQQFRPRRINPEDVPPGMRVVSTPFGDRLVENE